MEKKYFLGIDIGSLSANAVIIDKKNEILGYEIILTGASSKKAAERVIKLLLEKCGINPDDIASAVATGYGRIQVIFRGQSITTITEITCHAKGAHYFFPKARTVIDIGGQDSKVIKIDKTGRVIDFAMNDKCAAGTGRFLENTAKALGIKLEDMGSLSLKSAEEVNISSMCTVFAESEVVSLVGDDKKIEDICRGLHLAIAKRISAQVKRVGPENDIVMTGGVAKNIGVVKEFEKILGVKINIPEEPQIVGALGAALFAKEGVMNNDPQKPLDSEVTKAELDSNLIETDLPKMGLTCSYVPVEMVRAAGFHPVRLFSDTAAGSCASNGCSNVCSYIKSILEQKTAGCLDDLSGIIFANSCDSMKNIPTIFKSIDEMEKKICFYFLLDVPKNNDELSINYFATQIQILRKELEKLTEKTITESEIKKSVILYNKMRLAVLETIKKSAKINFGLLRRSINAVPEKFIDFLKKTPENLIDNEINDGKIKLYLYGGLLEDDKIFQIIKECGARVAADDLCNYSRYFDNLIEENHPPIEAIARRYLTRVPCPRMQASPKKIKDIIRAIKQENLDGVIYYSLKFCDPVNTDLTIAKIQFGKEDIPFLDLVCDSTGNYGQIKTRIEAFIESLRKKSP